MTAAIAAAAAVLVLAGLARGGALAGHRQQSLERLQAPSPHRGTGGAEWFRVWWGGRPPVHRRALVSGLPELLDEVGRSLRAGASVRQALAEAAGVVGGASGAAVGRVVADAERGMPMADALRSWASDDAPAEVGLAAAALVLALDAGGTPARAVDGVAATLRERRALSLEVRAQSVQARLSAVVIALLPVVFTTWCAATDRRIASFLFATPAGWACLAGGAGLLAVGGGWMARIVRSVA